MPEMPLPEETASALPTGPARCGRIAGLAFDLAGLTEAPSSQSADPALPGGAGELHDETAGLVAALHLPRPGDGLFDLIQPPSESINADPLAWSEAGKRAGNLILCTETPGTGDVVDAGCVPGAETGVWLLARAEANGADMWRWRGAVEAPLGRSRHTAEVALTVSVPVSDSQSPPALTARALALISSVHGATLRHSPAATLLIGGLAFLSLLTGLASSLLGGVSSLATGLCALVAGAAAGGAIAVGWRWREGVLWSSQVAPRTDMVGCALLSRTDAVTLATRQLAAAGMLIAHGLREALGDLPAGLACAAALSLSLPYPGVWMAVGAVAAGRGVARVFDERLHGGRADGLQQADLWAEPTPAPDAAARISAHLLPLLQQGRHTRWARARVMPRVLIALLLTGAALQAVGWLPVRWVDVWVLTLGGGGALWALRRHLLIPITLREHHNEWRADPTDDLAAEALARGFMVAEGVRDPLLTAGRALAWAAELARLQPSAGKPCLLIAAAALHLRQQFPDENAPPRKLCLWVADDALSASATRHMSDADRAEAEVFAARIRSAM